MDNQEKPVYHRTCRNPLCLKYFTTKRQKQEHCSPKCRQAVYMAKRDRVVDEAVLLISCLKLNQPVTSALCELQKAVEELGKKDGERP